jgi:tRNA-splicing ligase RtcB
MLINDFIKISDYEWELPKSYRPDMRVSIRLFASQKLLTVALDDSSLIQAVNVATLPGLVGPVVVMPDVHQGYGFPIGGVAATEFPHGVISPGGIGYDINCGVRLLSSRIRFDDAKSHLVELAVALNANCPSGMGKAGTYQLRRAEIDDVCHLGAKWAVNKGLGTIEDLQRTEENGCVEGADPIWVSERAKVRGSDQLGTLGSGNHFIEVDVVDKIYDFQAAQAMQLEEGCLVLQFHCGSRGLGHQVCSDYVQEFQSAVRRYGIQLPDRELVCAPMDSPEGQHYLAAMRSAANFAFCNRQILAYLARRAFEQTLSGKGKDAALCQVYDVTHNMGKMETHTIAGHQKKLCVHRKGATRAFGPSRAELPDEYLLVGQPVLVPGSMGTASWVLAGTDASMERSFGSTCHGAGRLMSRSKARREVRGDQLRDELEQNGIHIQAGSMAGLAEEAPLAYKDVDEVVETVCGAGIARKVARLRPVVVVKG